MQICCSRVQYSSDCLMVWCVETILQCRCLMSAFIWLAMFALVLKWLEGGRGTNFCWPIPYKFPSFFNLPLLSKWKMASIIKLSRENTELSLAKITSKRVGLAIKIRSWLQIFLIESLASTIWSAGYKHKVFSSSSFLGKIDYEVLWKLTDCSSWSLKPLWAFRNTAATFLFNAKFFFSFFFGGINWDITASRKPEAKTDGKLLSCLIPGRIYQNMAVKSKFQVPEEVQQYFKVSMQNCKMKIKVRM